MPYEHVITNAQTGEVTVVPFTQAEIDAYLLANQPKVPASVSRAQARKALVLQGLFSSVQPAIDSIQDPVQRQLVQIDWDDSLVFGRNNSTLAMLAASLGLTEQQLDGLFFLAESL